MSSIQPLRNALVVDASLAVLDITLALTLAWCGFDGENRGGHHLLLATFLMVNAYCAQESFNKLTLVCAGHVGTTEVISWSFRENMHNLATPILWIHSRLPDPAQQVIVHCMKVLLSGLSTVRTNAMVYTFGRLLSPARIACPMPSQRHTVPITTQPDAAARLALLICSCYQRVRKDTQGPVSDLSSLSSTPAIPSSSSVDQHCSPMAGDAIDDATSQMRRQFLGLYFVWMLQQISQATAESFPHSATLLARQDSTKTLVGDILTPDSDCVPIHAFATGCLLIEKLEAPSPPLSVPNEDTTANGRRLVTRERELYRARTHQDQVMRKLDELGRVHIQVLAALEHADGVIEALVQERRDYVVALASIMLVADARPTLSTPLAHEPLRPGSAATALRASPGLSANANCDTSSGIKAGASAISRVYAGKLPISLRLQSHPGLPAEAGIVSYPRTPLDRGSARTDDVTAITAAAKSSNDNDNGSNKYKVSGKVEPPIPFPKAPSINNATGIPNSESNGRDYEALRGEKKRTSTWTHSPTRTNHDASIFTRSHGRTKSSILGKYVPPWLRMGRSSLARRPSSVKNMDTNVDKDAVRSSSAHLTGMHERMPGDGMTEVDVSVDVGDRPSLSSDVERCFFQDIQESGVERTSIDLRSCTTRVQAAVERIPERRHTSIHDPSRSVAIQSSFPLLLSPAAAADDSHSNPAGPRWATANSNSHFSSSPRTGMESDNNHSTWRTIQGSGGLWSHGSRSRTSIFNANFTSEIGLGSVSGSGSMSFLGRPRQTSAPVETMSGVSENWREREGAAEANNNITSSAHAGGAVSASPGATTGNASIGFGANREERRRNAPYFAGSLGTPILRRTQSNITPNTCDVQDSSSSRHGTSWSLAEKLREHAAMFADSPWNRRAQERATIAAAMGGHATRTSGDRMP